MDAGLTRKVGGGSAVIGLAPAPIRQLNGSRRELRIRRVCHLEFLFIQV